MTGWMIDSFSAMECLTRMQQGQTAIVLRALDRAKRFTCFEASENSVIAATMTRIYQARAPLLEPETETDAYPWHRVVLTPHGRSVAGLADPPEAGA